MSSFRTLILFSGVVALAACGQMTASKDKDAPATADSSAPAATTADASGAKPGEATGGGDKPAEPAQAPANAAPDKPT